MSRLLGLDWGTKRIGVAVSDDSKIIAQTPVEAISNNPKVFDNLKALIKKYSVEQAIIGLPFSLDGSEQGSAKKARQFGERLNKETRIPIEYMDERFTSVAATSALRQAGGRNREKGDIDNAAAQILLQAYLDKKRDIYEK